MSLASVISSRLSCTITPTISWALPTLQRFLPAVQVIQSRSVWQEVVRQVPSEDPQRQGQMTFEDVDLTDLRIVRATRAEGEFVPYQTWWSWATDLSFTGFDAPWLGGAICRTLFPAISTSRFWWMSLCPFIFHKSRVNNIFFRSLKKHLSMLGYREHSPPSTKNQICSAWKRMDETQEA